MSAAGINPLPVQRPIPIWLGGGSEKAIRRAAQIADGYFPHPYSPLEGGWPVTISKLRGFVEEAGRDGSSFGLEAWVMTGRDNKPDTWKAEIDEWCTLDATHLSFSTIKAGFSSPDQHLARLAEVKAIAS